jgi:hypothetical protein
MDAGRWRGDRQDKQDEPCELHAHLRRPVISARGASRQTVAPGPHDIENAWGGRHDRAHPAARPVPG